MTFATLTNIILILLCGAVLVQSVRMMRNFETVKNGGLKDMVEALDKATAQARLVLGDLKETLRTEGAASARSIARGEEMREELTVMVGIANAVAERIVQTVEASPKAKAPEAPQPEPAKVEATPAPAPIAVKPEPVQTVVTPEPVKIAAKPQRPRSKSAPRGKRSATPSLKPAAAVQAS